MRIRKIFLTILTLILLLSLVIIFSYRKQKIQTQEYAISVQAPRSTTWNYLTDTSLYKKWILDYNSAKLNSGRDNRLGASYNLKFVTESGKVRWSKRKILKIKPFENIQYSYAEKDQEGEIEYKLEDLSMKECYLRVQRTFKFKGISNYISSLILPSKTELKDEQQLNKFKSIIESAYESKAGPINKKRIPAVRIAK